MGTTDRLGELRMQMSPHLIRVIAEREAGISSAELSRRAVERFDGLLTAARIFHTEHPEEDPDLHMSHLMQVFDESGVPALLWLPVINELVLNKEPAD